MVCGACASQLNSSQIAWQCFAHARVFLHRVIFAYRTRAGCTANVMSVVIAQGTQQHPTVTIWETVGHEKWCWDFIDFRMRIIVDILTVVRVWGFCCSADVCKVCHLKVTEK